MTEDLVQLVTKIRLEMSKLSDNLELNASNFRRLSELTLARIVLFNKRRTGESSRVTIQDYEKAKKSQEIQASNEEILCSLSDLEKKLAQSLFLIEIKGKRGQKVPMLLPKDASNAVEILLKARSEFIPATNNFLFPLPGKETYLRGWDILAKLTREFKCKKPSSITGTKLRKYLATTVQVMNLAEVEQDWLARHLGHDIRVHREFYRQHESIVELSKISKILIASENGLTQKYKGQTMEDIPAEDLLPEENNSDLERDNEENDEDKADESFQEKQSNSKQKRYTLEKRKKRKAEESLLEEEDDGDKEKQISEKQKKPRLQKKSHLPEDEDSNLEPDEDEYFEEKKRSSKKKQKCHQRKKTQNNEKKTLNLEQRTKLFNFFEDQIKNLSIPRKEAIENFKTLFQIDLEWRVIKDILNARIQRDKKKSQA